MIFIYVWGKLACCCLFTHHLVNMLTLSDRKMSHLLYILTNLAFTLIKMN